MEDALTPSVEMLWESGDPGAILRSRFGFSSGRAVAGWLGSALGDRWGLQVMSCDRIVMSDSNALAWVGTSAGPMVAKWSIATDRFARLGALARLTTWLGEQGLPVSSPVPTTSGSLQVEIGGSALSLQREIAGELLDAGDPLQVRAAGAALSRLHAALAGYPEADRFPVPPAAEVALGTRIDTWLRSAPLHLPGSGCEALRQLVASAPSDELPVQLVHGDYRSANVLVARREVVAVIDLEEARSDHRVVEVARSAVMLGTQFHDWGPVPSEVHVQFLEGYRSVGSLTPDEMAWWPALVLWSSLMMVPAGQDPTGWGPATMALLG